MSSARKLTIVKWHRQDGDIVRREELICQIENEHAVVDVPAHADGILRHLAKVGDAVRHGCEIARINPIG